MLSCLGSPHLPQILGDLMEEFNERAQSTGLLAARRWYWRAILRNLVALAARREMTGKARPRTSKNVVPDLRYVVQHRAVVDMALAWLAHGVRASSVGPCDGCGFSRVFRTGDWLVDPFALGTHQTRFAFAYARQTLSISSTCVQA